MCKTPIWSKPIQTRRLVGVGRLARRPVELIAAIAIIVAGRLFGVFGHLWNAPDIAQGPGCAADGRAAMRLLEDPPGSFTAGAVLGLGRLDSQAIGRRDDEGSEGKRSDERRKRKHLGSLRSGGAPYGPSFESSIYVVRAHLARTIEDLVLETPIAAGLCRVSRPMPMASRQRC